MCESMYGLLLLVMVAQHERQVEKGRAEELLQQLDTDWKEVHSLLLRTVSIASQCCTTSLCDFRTSNQCHLLVLMIMTIT